MTPKRLLHFMVLPVAVILSVTPASAQSPYAGEEQRPIKSLSKQEIAALKKGQGMGFAKLAELNGYPGPKHVLELADALALDDDQLAGTQALFRHMQLEAIRLGEAIIEAERQLDEAFEQERVTAESLKENLDEIGALRARLRYVHLQAHLQQKALLTDEQIATYISLRGYRLDVPERAEHSHHRD